MPTVNIEEYLDNKSTWEFPDGEGLYISLDDARDVALHAVATALSFYKQELESHFSDPDQIPAWIDNAMYRVKIKT